jgi:hypothetical protein
MDIKAFAAVALNDYGFIALPVTEYFWDITLCSLLKLNQCFIEHILHLEGRRINLAGNQHESRALLATCFCAGSS